MFKMLPPTFLVFPIGWLALALYQLVGRATPLLTAFGLKPQPSWITLALQGLAALVFLTPLWRLIWRLVPQLNRLFYPDLHGEWDVEVSSSYSRVDAIVEAAAGRAVPLDMRAASQAALPALRHRKLKAVIRQGWASIDIEMWDPTIRGPIRFSRTQVVEPFRDRRGYCGLAYVFDQDNDTDDLADDRSFKGAAWILCDRRDLNILSGRMWNDRVWRRGMNTAADVVFTRSRPWRSAWAATFQRRGHRT